MSLPDEAIQEFKEIAKKEYGKVLTDAEAREQGENLVGLVKLLMEQAQIDFRRKKKLKDHPKGFHLGEHEGVYNCLICHKSISGTETWWDENGQRCMDCQWNIEQGVIPASACHWKNTISSWKLKDEYGLHPSTARKLVRKGKLKARDLKTKAGAKYHTVYLVDENIKYLKQIKKSGS